MGVCFRGAPCDFSWVYNMTDKHRKSAEIFLCAGTDNQSNKYLSVKRSTTKWPLMLVNVQLSSLLSRSKLSLTLKWRPREENTIADELTNKDFTHVELSQRLPLRYADLPLSLLHSLWETWEQFDQMKVSARASQSMGHGVKRKKQDFASMEVDSAELVPFGRWQIGCSIFSGNVPATTLGGRYTGPIHSCQKSHGLCN